jgi:hypothetical protein
MQEIRDFYDNFLFKQLIKQTRTNKPVEVNYFLNSRNQLSRLERKIVTALFEIDNEKLFDCILKLLKTIDSDEKILDKPKFVNLILNDIKIDQLKISNPFITEYNDIIVLNIECKKIIELFKKKIKLFDITTKVINLIRGLSSNNTQLLFDH